MTQRFPGLMSQYLVLAHFLLNRETRWDVGIPGVYVAFSALGGRLQSSHCQTTAHQQENNTSRDQRECTYTQHTSRLHMPLCWHAFNSVYHNILRNTWTTQQYHHCSHVSMHCFVLLRSWYYSLKLFFVLFCCSHYLRDKEWLYMEVFTQALREVTYHYQRGCPGPSLLVKQSPILYIFKSGEW